MSKPLTEEGRKKIVHIAQGAIAFMRETCAIFHEMVLRDNTYRDLIMGDIYKLRTHYMGLVDRQGRVNFYDGDIRVVTPEGKKFVQFRPREYLRHIAEHIETWSYVKYAYLRKKGWQGFTEGAESGIYRVAPLARLNVADAVATPHAQGECETLFSTLGGKPAHNTLAFHWARLVEALYAAEHMLELAQDKEITDPHIRNIPSATPREGVGAVEAPRGTLIHHYKTDRNGLITEANLLVATVHNTAAICMSVEKAARGHIRGGIVSDGLLNMIEMSFRAYDPCFACATHMVQGISGPSTYVRNSQGEEIKRL
jgi:F420-non-reducing hydrogenase large subunit